MTIEEKRRGEFIHRVLFFIDYVKDGFEKELKEIIRRVSDETGSNYSFEETNTLVMALTSHRETAKYFTEMPGREIRKEQEYSDGSGRLFRMDRVVIDTEGVTVIDYKTGKDKAALEKYRQQMRNYIGILCDVYSGKTVRGVIAFIDLGEVEHMG
jgi:ATP-dependent exoDNAse (exonuclease V) beta subunit